MPTRKLQIYRNGLTYFFKRWSLRHFNLHLVIIFFFTGLRLNVLTSWGKMLYTITSYVCLHVCDLQYFHNAHVNVNIYFETILLLEGSLSYWALSAREIKVLICVGKIFYSSSHNVCTYTITSCIAMAACITPYELSGVTNNVAVICVYLQFASSYICVTDKNH